MKKMPLSHQNQLVQSTEHTGVLVPCTGPRNCGSYTGKEMGFCTERQKTAGDQTEFGAQDTTAKEALLTAKGMAERTQQQRQ